MSRTGVGSVTSPGKPFVQPEHSQSVISSLTSTGLTLTSCFFMPVMHNSNVYDLYTRLCTELKGGDQPPDRILNEKSGGFEGLGLICETWEGTCPLVPIYLKHCVCSSGTAPMCRIGSLMHVRTQCNLGKYDVIKPG